MNIEEIHDYLEDRLSQEDKALFIQKMNDNEELRREVMLQSKIIEHSEAAENINQSMDVIADVHKKYASKETSQESEIHQIEEAEPIIIKQPPWKLIGLFILGILGLLYILSTQLNQVPPSPPQLYAEYFVLPDASFNTKGSNAKEDLQKAEIAYNSEEYQKAIELFNSYANSEEAQNDEVAFYVALSHMALSDFDSAKEEFNQLKKSNALFAKDCDWYLSLIYLKEGDSEMALELLRKFSSGTYKERAQAIIEQMEMPI